MQNARALDERLRGIIKEVSDHTGREIKQDLVKELADNVHEDQSRAMRSFLKAINSALKKI